MLTKMLGVQVKVNLKESLDGDGQAEPKSRQAFISRDGIQSSGETSGPCKPGGWYTVVYL
jgi:hypothetical protein